MLNYLFFDDSHALRPYVGAGGPTRLSLSASVGPVGVLGLSYHWTRRWAAYASYSFSSVSTDLTADTAGAIRTTHIDFRPQALIVAVGYSF